MKKLMLLCAAGIVALVSLAGCAGAPQAATTFQAQVVKACAVVQPTLQSVQAMTVDDPAKQVILAQLVKDNGAVCAAGASVDASSVQSLVNTSVPAAIQVVGLLPLDPAARSGVQIGLMAFQVALAAALAQYGAPAPSSTLAPASAPAAPAAAVAGATS
ncbi:hypothetical protein [Cupriavidus malaysiensis]|uniref:Lipoprotein n=1 Tax=Cupriavidus malaysiensis TaxID=367825 RepID=A0ABM6F5P0_9BURK|nr:hypothetical protein [Cupriavidus malaysiensis]AOZ06681.1 hypothetical protein BKK80_13315 [Cupriavidus malaysiensis]